MNKLYGENMSEDRKTNIVEDIKIDEEIVDELQDEIFEVLKDALLQESRLLKRFYDFCQEYNAFEFDEMGLNMEEADEVLVRVNKIRDKLLQSIKVSTSYEFKTVQTDELYYKILLDIIIDEDIKHCIIEVDIDSFNLEVC